jgi:hypothetical protein
MRKLFRSPKRLRDNGARHIADGSSGDQGRWHPGTKTGKTDLIQVDPWRDT